MVKTKWSFRTLYVGLLPPRDRVLGKLLTLFLGHFHKGIIFSFDWQNTTTSGVDENYRMEILQNVTDPVIPHLKLHSHWSICHLFRFVLFFVFVTDRRRNKLFHSTALV